MYFERRGQHAVENDSENVLYTQYIKASVFELFLLSQHKNFNFVMVLCETNDLSNVFRLVQRGQNRGGNKTYVYCLFVGKLLKRALRGFPVFVLHTRRNVVKQTFRTCSTYRSMYKDSENTFEFVVNFTIDRLYSFFFFFFFLSQDFQQLNISNFLILNLLFD